MGANSVSGSGTGSSTTGTTPPGAPHTCALMLRQYTAQTFGATFTSDAPSGVTVNLTLSKGRFQTIVGNDQSGDVAAGPMSTTDDTGTARFLFATDQYDSGPNTKSGTTQAQLTASSTWCTAAPVPITLLT